MIALDTNILVHFQRSDMPFHDRAVEVVRSLAEGRERWAVPWPCFHEFFAVVTSARIFKVPTRPEQAMDAIRALSESPTLTCLSEGIAHLETLAGLVDAGKVSGAMIHDARIAAICLDHGVRMLYTADRDYSRFPKLKIINPLLAGSAG